MTVRLYVIPISNPANAVRGMLAHKRLDHRLVRFAPGFHPLLVRAAGFAGATVPALDVDGHKVQGTLEISRYLDELVPERPLFPADPEQRRAVEEAERWGEGVLQHVPRRIFRQALVDSQPLRVWLSDKVIGLPAPALGAVIGLPMIKLLATVSGADPDASRAELAQLPALLERVDALIAAGTIGGDVPNAADFQILSSVAALNLMRPRTLEGRPCMAAAARLFPRYDGTPIPAGLAPDWLAPALRS